MKNYLAVIRRADFIDLYKYGFSYLDKSRIAEFNCEAAALPGRTDIFDALFTRMNSFESSFTYLIIHYTKGEGEDAGDYSFVHIEELRHIFPLDREAQREFETSFDEHIKIEAPIWSDAVSLVKKKQLLHSSMQGARNVFHIFKLDGFDTCKEVISDETIERLLADVYEDIHPQGDLPIWVYLMRYERHSFYPKGPFGYFMDVVHVIVNFLSKQEEDDSAVEGTNIYKALYKLYNQHRSQKLNSLEIMELLKSEDSARAFLEKVSTFVSNGDFITTAVCYLNLRDLYQDSFSYDKKTVEICKSNYGTSFTLAAYMVGIALSHDKTYSCLYETLPLPIYRSREELEAVRQRKQMEQARAKREMEYLDQKRNEEQKRKSKGKGPKKKVGQRGEERSPFVEPGRRSKGGGYYNPSPQQPGESYPSSSEDKSSYTQTFTEKQTSSKRTNSTKQTPTKTSSTKNSPGTSVENQPTQGKLFQETEMPSTQEEALNTQKEAKSTQAETQNTQEVTQNTQKEALNTQKEALNTQEEAKSTQAETQNTQEVTQNTQKEAKSTQEVTQNTQEVTQNTQEVTQNTQRENQKTQAEMPTRYPATLQKYTRTSRLSNAKNSSVEVKNEDEYHKFLQEHSDEDWRIKH